MQTTIEPRHHGLSVLYLAAIDTLMDVFILILSTGLLVGEIYFLVHALYILPLLFAHSIVFIAATSIYYQKGELIESIIGGVMLSIFMALILPLVFLLWFYHKFLAFNV